MLSVFCGQFSDLEDAFIARLEKLRGKAAPGALPRSLVVVAPSRRMAERLERFCAVARGLPLINVHFHTFFSLALLVLEDTGFPKETLLSDSAFFDRVMDAVLDENQGLSRRFGGAARPKALARSLRSSLRDLIDSGASPADILEYFGAVLEAEDAGRQKLAELLRLAALYDEKLNRLGLLSSTRMTRLAAQKAAEPCAVLDGFAEILYYGFYDLTGVQTDFFEAVAKNRSASLFFPYRKGHPAFHFADAFYEQKILGLAQNVEHLEPRPHKTALGPALDVLFASSPPTSPPSVTGRLRVMSASGEGDEAWLCAKEILRLVESGQCRYEDIGVMARSLEPYRSAIVGVFEENAIPYALAAKEPLLRHPLAKAAWTILSAKRRDFPARILEDVFSSPYFAPPLGATSSFLHRWRGIIERLQIRAGWLQWEGKLKDCASQDFAVQNEDGEALFVIPREDVKALWDFVLTLESVFDGCAASWSAAAQEASDLIFRLLKLPEDVSPAERQAAESVRGLIESLRVFDRLGEKPAWDDVLDVLEEKFKKAMTPAPKSGRGVRVMDAMAGRGESFDFLFLMGLKEKSFPREIREDPLLRDSERAFLRHPVGCWMGLKSSGYEEERLLFYLAAAAAKKGFYGVYPRADESGKAQTPSFYLLQLCRAAGLEWTEDKFYRRAARQPGQKIAECPPRELSPREVSLRLALSGQNPAPYLSQAGRARQAALAAAGLSQMARFSSWSSPGALDGLVGPPHEYLRELLLRGLSPSAFKTFCDCPFQFFAERVLDLDQAEDAADKDAMDKRARGKIYHEILERFYKAWCAAPYQDWQKGLEKAGEEVFARSSWRALGLYPVLWESEKRAMTAHARAFAAWDIESLRAQGWRPATEALEKDLRAPWPGRLPEGLAELQLHGRVDRVDVDSTGRRYRIVDYKTRISDYIRKSKGIQLSFYAELAQGAFGADKELESARIFGIEAAGSRGREEVYAGDAWRKDRDTFWSESARNLERLAQGFFPIKPDDKNAAGGHCAWCSFSSMCRKSHGASRHRGQLADER